MTRASMVMLLVVALAGCNAARAQDDGEEGDEQSSIDGLAEAMAAAFAPRWEGPTVEWPERPPRPYSGGLLRSELHPVNVHLGPGASYEEGEAALAALEEAHAWLEEGDWPLPPPDGGHGDTLGFDLYLAPVEPGEGPRRQYVETSWDAPTYGGWDGVLPFAVVDPDAAVPGMVRPCVISAAVQASLLAADPGESQSWRVATGDYVAWLLTGHFGCGDEGLTAHQADSWRGWISDDPTSGPGGALFLAMLSARTDGSSGRFIRDLWSGAPQQTWESSGPMRAEPHMWMVVDAVMEVGEDPLDQLLEEFAVARYFIGPPTRSVGAPLRILGAMPQDATVPVMGNVAFDELPRRFEPRDLEIEAHGSAYVMVDVSEAPPESQLRIWLRGEMGVGWSLIAVRLDAEGQERGRVRAPVRPLNPRSYIPLELTDGETDRVLVVVTNMGARLADASHPDDQVRSFRMILDRADGSAEGSPEEEAPTEE